MSDLMDMARRVIGNGPPKRESAHLVRKRIDALIVTVKRLLKDAERIGLEGRNYRVSRENIKNLEFSLQMLEDVR